ncbi:sensor histidine kinase [Mesorhizobium comanense]|uniref:sensor histidine kinase n=1 Tax=Mesorhizobium comanense TaxID=2502215 RepID=UPI0010F83DDD|nr:sensor histidine kinase [Mesorhizobium comanense]
MAVRLGHGEIVSPVEFYITEANVVSRALTNASFDRSQAEDHMRLVVNELSHRTKNMLTMVQAMMRQTAKNHEVSPDYQKAVSDRLAGLANSIDLLTANNWSGATLGKLVESHLGKFAYDSGQIIVRGEELSRRPEAVHVLGLALHELATNAVKYGALSTPTGCIIVSWKVTGAASLLEFSWTEHDGPSVSAPTRTGFGSKIIKQHVEATFGGKVSLEYEPKGLCWTVIAPLERFIDPISAEIDPTS